MVVTKSWGSVVGIINIAQKIKAMSYGNGNDARPVPY